MASLVDITSAIVHSAVECTRSPQFCALLQRHVIQSGRVLVCEWSHLEDLDHRGYPRRVHKEESDNNHHRIESVVRM